MSLVGRTVDDLLEASVVASYSRLGYLARRSLFGWGTELPPDPFDARGCSAVVTGASSGIGFAVADALVRRGWGVLAVSRDPERNAGAVAKLRATAAAFGQSDASAAVTGHVADLRDLGEVRRVAEELSRAGPLAALVHDAGALYRTFHLSDQGFEATFALYVLGPTLLTSLLLPALRAGASPERPARVVTVSSGGVHAARLDIDRLAETRPARYRPFATYASAARTQVELAREWAFRLADSGVLPVTMHPGWVATRFAEHSAPVVARLAAPLLRTPGEGADTAVWLTSAHGATLVPGGFYLDRRVRSAHLLPRTRTTALERSAAFEEVARLAGAVVPARDRTP